MELAITVFAFITGLYLLFNLLEYMIGIKKILNLADQPTIKKEELPFVSIILSALDEEQHIEQAITMLSQFDYPHYEIIAINDRSTDKTPQILDKLKATIPHLQVVHIDQLPAGWFGKNHALQVGSQMAKGEWLLFTDADVFMQKQALAKAISYVVTKKLEHLVVIEHHIRKTFWLNVMLLAHYVTFYNFLIKPWRIRQPWSKKFIGRGPFNLIKKSSYEKFNGYQAIALECADDFKLGEVAKKSGLRQDAVFGQDLVVYEWYDSAASMVKGFEKNNFAYYKYRLPRAASDLAFAIIFFFWPVFAVFLCSGPAQWLNIINLLLMTCFATQVAKERRVKKYYAGFFLIGVGFLMYAIMRSIFCTYKNKGVYWRGTHYCLKELREYAGRK